MLKKLAIKAFAASDRRTVLGEWRAQINPEGYREAYRTVLADDHGIDSAGAVLRYKTQKPRELSLRFFVDATGVVPGVTDVAEEISTFRALAWSYNGQEHSPNLLDVIWGQLVFRCVLVSLDIDYTLFSPDGMPLRAEFSAGFRAHRTPEDIARETSKRSADLTHIQTLNAGMTLPLMAHRIYGDPGYHVDVARANNLDDLRLTDPGARIVFPRMKG